MILLQQKNYFTYFFDTLKEWFLLSILLFFLLLFFYFHLYRYLTFTTIKTYQTYAQEWTIAHYQAAVGLYLSVFVIMIACGIPCATILTLVGGLLFGNIALIYSILATTLGGTILFLAIRTTLGKQLTIKSSGWIKRMEHGFQRNAFYYLLLLRLVPIFPCWISNISAGIMNVPLKTFLGATILGIIPSTFIYVMAGRGLDKFLAAEQQSILQILLTPSIFFPFLGLAFLSLLPIFYKSIKKYQQDLK